MTALADARVSMLFRLQARITRQNPARWLQANGK